VDFRFRFVPVLVGNSPRPKGIRGTSPIWTAASIYCSLFWIDHINPVLLIGVTIYYSNVTCGYWAASCSLVVSGFLLPYGVNRLAICDNSWCASGCNVDARLKVGTVNLANNICMHKARRYWLYQTFCLRLFDICVVVVFCGVFELPGGGSNSISTMDGAYTSRNAI